MPKPFTIGIEVEEVALGLVMRKLNSLPGIVAIHMDFDKPAKPNGTRGPGRPRKDEAGERKTRKVLDETGEEAIVAFLKKRKTMSTADLRDAFSAQGRAPGSVNSCLFKAQKAGAVIRTDRDTYALAKTKPKTKPKAKKETPTV